MKADENIEQIKRYRGKTDSFKDAFHKIEQEGQYSSSNQRETSHSPSMTLGSFSRRPEGSPYVASYRQRGNDVGGFSHLASKIESAPPNPYKPIANTTSFKTEQELSRPPLSARSSEKVQEESKYSNANVESLYEHQLPLKYEPKKQENYGPYFSNHNNERPLNSFLI